MKDRAYTILDVLVIIVFISLVLSMFTNNINLRKNSNLKGLIFNIGAYKSAIYNFEKKYGFLPGDIQKTMVFELSTHNTDGNQNGLIEDKNMQKSIYNKPLKMDGELTNFWIHLKNAGFLGNQKKTIPSINFFKSNIIVYNNNGRNVFNISAIGVSSNKDIITKNVMKPFQAYYIDKKLDDGMPYSGNIFVTSGNKIYTNNTSVKKNTKCAADFEYLTIFKRNLCQILIEI